MSSTYILINDSGNYAVMSYTHQRVQTSHTHVGVKQIIKPVEDLNQATVFTPYMLRQEVAKDAIKSGWIKLNAYEERKVIIGTNKQA